MKESFILDDRKDVTLPRSPSPYPPPSLLPNSFDIPQYVKESDTSSPSPSEITISPALLWAIVILAVIFFLFGIFHLLLKLFSKNQSFLSISQPNRYSEISRTHSLRRQLQQLFLSDDSGLDQSVIDALPVFYYKDIKNLKEPFDCAVCLCVFSPHDKLRLIPICSHAFHTQCIDVWLLSNSTCPLCRANLSSGLPAGNPLYNHITPTENSISISSSNVASEVHFDKENLEKRVLSIRLGKLKSFNGGDDNGEDMSNGGEISRYNLDARRCFSMSSSQYVVNDSDLQLDLFNVNGNLCCGKTGINGDDMDGRKVTGTKKGESFSVSKIWLWSKKRNLQESSSSYIKDVFPGV